jgi:UDP-N-acetylmuramyl pentapeptide phosphotransferase/UDP-N-acetylglucosamine-1-phosphate transferase
MIYVLLFGLFISIELIYFAVAESCNIIDKPNSRSSHSTITIIGGGVVFPLAISIAFLLGYTNWILHLAVLIIGLISFIDDMKPLSIFPRFISHFIAVGLVFYDLNMFTEPLWLLPILFVMFIGWVNAFNFMDGINGIMVLYALTSIVSFSLLDVRESDLSLLITMGLACVAFGIFNVQKKAKTFAGDVGSISMALFLGYFMIKTILDSGQIGYIMFFSVYGIDTVITILNRIKKRENIFQPHRSHLYQYLANEMGFSQISVAFLYAGLQLLINGFVIYMDRTGSLNLFSVFQLLMTLILAYLLVRFLIIRKIELKKSLIHLVE